jgi:Copper amine oxidase N-terminal domain
MRITIALAVLALGLPALPAGAQQRVAVSAVAAHSGYTYRWAPQGSVVVLSRPGMVVVLRPGSQVYQVNDHDEVADMAPSYSRGDLYVSASLAGHLEALARRLSPTAAHSAETLATTDTSARGAITMEARQLQGAEAITVNGSAPAGAPVTITLLAVVSSDIPTIVVSRNDVVTDESGRFTAIIPIASAYERGTLLRVVATSSAGVASASTQLVMEAPNNGVTVPLEQLPH